MVPHLTWYNRLVIHFHILPGIMISYMVPHFTWYYGLCSDSVAPVIHHHSAQCVHSFSINLGVCLHPLQVIALRQKVKLRENPQLAPLQSDKKTVLVVGSMKKLKYFEETSMIILIF